MLIKDDIAERKAKVAARRAALPAGKQAELDKLLSKPSAENPPERIILRRPESGPGPLSSAQLRLWFLNQMDPGSAVYNIAVAFSLEGKLNVEALQRSLNEIIKRHDSLRTNFVAVDGNPSPV